MSKKISRKLSTLMVLALLVFMVGCGAQKQSSNNSSSSNGKEPVKFGVVLPMTGVAALYGKQVTNGINVAVDMINKSGGILGGRPIKVFTEDDKANPEEGVSATKKLITQDKVSVITGGVNSSVSLAQVQVTKDAKMFQVVTVSKAPAIRQQGNPYLVALNSTTDMDGLFFHKYIADNLKPKTVAVLVENTDYGKAEVAALQKDWAGEGSPKIVDTEWFNLTDTDWTVQLTKIKGLNPDAIYVTVASPSSNGAIFNQIKETGYKGMKLMAPGNLNKDVIKLAGDGVEGLISADIYANSAGNADNKAFVDAFKAKYNDEMPEKMEVLGFESVYVVAKAMDKVGTDSDYAKIVDVLKSNSWNTPRGVLKFDSNGQAQASLMAQEVKKGQITVRQ